MKTKTTTAALVVANVANATDETGVTICGIYAGKEIAPNLYAENVANAR